MSAFRPKVIPHDYPVCRGVRHLQKGCTAYETKLQSFLFGSSDMCGFTLTQSVSTCLVSIYKSNRSA